MNHAYQTGVNDAPRKVSDVEARLDELSSKQVQMDAALDRLALRLEPVLLPDAPPPGRGIDSIGGPQSSLLCNQLDAAISWNRVALDRLQGLIDRLSI